MDTSAVLLCSLSYYTIIYIEFVAYHLQNSSSLGQFYLGPFLAFLLLQQNINAIIKARSLVRVPGIAVTDKMCFLNAV